MKRNVLFIVVPVWLLAFTCQKPSPVGRCVQGKVIRITCASTVVQVLNQKRNWTPAWKDTMHGDQAYENVFSVANKCSFPENLKEGDNFWFVLREPHPDSTCAVCMMYDAPPPDKFNVENISHEPCP